MTPSDMHHRLGAAIADEAATCGMAEAERRVRLVVASGRWCEIGGGTDPFLVERTERRLHQAIIGAIAVRLPAWRAIPSTALINAVTAGCGFAPDELQASALRSMLSHPFTVVTGPPGCGKSTLIAAASRYLARAEPERRQIVTAYAAKIAVVTAAKCGLAGYTLHELTGTLPGQEDQGPGAPIDADIGTIYVDEAFATPPGLIHRILVQAPPDCRIVLCGDPDQLPPIGRGRALHDLVAVEAFPVARLRTSHRLGDNGHLAEQAQRASRGLPIRPGPGLKILFEQKPGRESDARKARLAVKLRGDAVAAGRRTIALTTSRHGAAGHAAINALVAGSDRPGLGHSVITTAGHRERLWRNGQSGLVVELDDDTRTMLVAFDDGSQVRTSCDDDTIVLAYAMSIHRAQGLEYDECIVVIGRGASRHATRQSLVSAMTRARRCTIITDVGVLDDVVKRDALTTRAPIAAYLDLAGPTNTTTRISS